MVKRQVKISKTMLFIWLMLASLILLITPRKVTNQLHLGFVGLFRPILGFGRSISLSRAVITRSPSETAGNKEYNNLYEKFRQLQNHCENLEAELDQERRKVGKLSGLRSRNVWERARLVLADIITAQNDKLGRELVINRGKSDGLAVGQFVLGENSIIGLISDVSASLAIVKLVTDPMCKLGVQIANSGDYIAGVMQGDGQNGAKIKNMRYPVKVGDCVYTYKEPWFVDTPIIIGVVTECKKSDAKPLLWDVIVEPACDAEKLQGVSVIILKPEYRD